MHECVNDVRISILDAPVVGTLPHFYDADERYNLLIDGLNPTESSHNIFMDLEPTTGSPLRGGKRMQFNMFLKRISQISKFFKVIKFQLTKLMLFYSTFG
jgi:hypothetical protein